MPQKCYNLKGEDVMEQIILTKMISDICPLIGCLLGIKGAYSYLNSHYDEYPFSDGHDIGEFMLLAIASTTILGTITYIVVCSNIHMELLCIIFDEYIGIIRSSLLAGYLIDILAAYVIETVGLRCIWYKCQDLLLENRL